MPRYFQLCGFDIVELHFSATAGEHECDGRAESSHSDDSFEIGCWVELGLNVHRFTYFSSSRGPKFQKFARLLVFAHPTRVEWNTSDVFAAFDHFTLKRSEKCSIRRFNKRSARYSIGAPKANKSRVRPTAIQITDQ
jgi:hypothetical protein